MKREDDALLQVMSRAISIGAGVEIAEIDWARSGGIVALLQSTGDWLTQKQRTGLKTYYDELMGPIPAGAGRPL